MPTYKIVIETPEGVKLDSTIEAPALIAALDANRLNAAMIHEASKFTITEITNGSTR